VTGGTRHYELCESIGLWRRPSRLELRDSEEHTVYVLRRPAVAVWDWSELTEGDEAVAKIGRRRRVPGSWTEYWYPVSDGAGVPMGDIHAIRRSFFDQRWDLRLRRPRQAEYHLWMVDWGSTWRTWRVARGEDLVGYMVTYVRRFRERRKIILLPGGELFAVVLLVAADLRESPLQESYPDG